MDPVLQAPVPTPSLLPDLSQKDMEQMTQYNITSTPVRYFYTGGFRYSNLEDAIAQAKRAAKLA